jgi:tetratricopeptide (TPR) repeat protein
MFWGEGKLVNLRQELAVLRRLPGADQWLTIEEAWVSVAAETDLAALRAGGEPPPGEPLEGLRFPEAPDFEAYRDALVSEIEAQRRPSAPAVDPAAALPSVAELWALHGEPPPAGLLEQALELPAYVLAFAEAALRRQGRIDEAGKWRGRPPPPTAAGQRRLGLALWRRDGPSARAEALLAAAGAHAELGALWLERAQSGERAAAEKALAWVGPADRPDALRLAAEVALRAADFAAFDVHHAKLAELARDSQNPPLLLEGALLGARCALARGRLRTAGELLVDARALAARMPGAEAGARVSLWEGQLAAAEGQLDRALPLLEAAAAGPHPWSRAAALASLGGLAAQAGALARATALHEEALAATRLLGDRAAAARMLNNVGATAERCGRHRAARGAFADALALAERLDDHELLAMTLLNLAEVERRLGRLGVVRGLVARALEPGLAALPPRRRALAMQIRADLELSCGRGEEAAAWFGRAAAAWSEAGDAATAEAARWLTTLAEAAPPLGADAWDGLMHSILVREHSRPDLRALAFDELLRWAPDAARAEQAAGLRTVALAPPSPALRALPALLAGTSPGHPWRPEGDEQPTLDELLAWSLALRSAPADAGEALALRRAVDVAAAGLLPSQAAGLRRRFGLESIELDG